MADEPISALTPITAADPPDLLAIVDDVPGVPVTRKISGGNLLISYNRAAAETAAGVTASDYRFDAGNSRRVGDIGNGAIDDRDALNTADSVANVRIAVGADYGTHLISSDLTFNNRLTIWPGEILKPASGVTITFDKFVNANDSEQIFDLTAALDGTAIVWPTFDRYEVPAAWFGAIPAFDATKSDQDVEINYAIDSLAARGGIIKLALGDYFCSDRIQIQENVTVQGVLNRGSNLRVSTNWNDTFDHLILFQDGVSTTSMFNARLENISVIAENNAFVTRVIWARAWNENCGLKHVVVSRFMVAGLEVTEGFGGAATAEINNVEFFASTSATASTQWGVRLVDPGLTVGWYQFIVKHFVAAGNATNGKTNFLGIGADGRYRVEGIGGLHCEKALACIALNGDSSYAGIGPQSSGNSDVDNIFSVSSNWNAGAGNISCTPPEKGGATGSLLKNNGTASDIVSSTANPFVYPINEIQTLANEATPTVGGGEYFLTGGTTTITDFDDGQEGQEITILSEHAITITDGTNIFLNGSVNFVMASTDSLILVQKADGNWYETSRSVN